MNLREAELQKGTAALLTAVAELKGLPLTLGKQTSQYIAMGVRQFIQDDFSRPIADAVKGADCRFEPRDVSRAGGYGSGG